MLYNFLGKILDRATLILIDIGVFLPGSCTYHYE